MEVEFKYLRPSILQKVSLLFDSDDTVSQSSFACFLLPNRTEIQLRSYLVVASFPRLPLPPPPPPPPPPPCRNSSSVFFGEDTPFDT